MNTFVGSFLLAGALSTGFLSPTATAGEGGVSAPRYQVLAPISQGNLTVFPVVTSKTHDTAGFLTLDEGLRSGEVVVTEAGQRPGMVRRPGMSLPQSSGADVNRLFIVNNSKRPLVLLAGEIVTGGKQDRVVGKDRIIPAGSDADLSVFCVEPGRWTEMRSANGSLQLDFGASGGLVQPSVRGEVMAKKDQQKVWDEVNRANSEMVIVGGARSAGEPVSSSYGRNANSPAMKQEVDKVVRPIERSYQSLIGELRDRKAVGVVVAVNGDIVWADIFASPKLLEKYWSKLVRSYAAEALTRRNSRATADVQQARAYLSRLDGNHEQTDTEPGVYRHTEISASGYKVFELTSLLPGTGFDLHLSKMAE